MKEANIFEKVGKATPYKIPEKYLEDFTPDIMEIYKASARKRRVFHYWKYAAAAAAVLILLVPGYMVLHKNVTGEKQVLADSSLVVDTSAQEDAAASQLNQSISELSDDELSVLASTLDSNIYKDQI